MSQADLLLLQTYGPWFLIAILVIRDLFPFLRDKLFPQVLKERSDDNERRWKLSERQVQAQEDIAAAVQQTAVLLATLDARTEVMAAGVSRVEVIATEINTRSRARELDIPTVRLPKKKSGRNDAVDMQRL